jgi:2-hydroxychromene-2-carboxylate isomerase
VQLGVFGAPTFIVRGHKERWWGQDRLFFVDRFLDRLRG